MRMDLRALLFTSDGSSTATLCQVMTDLGIQAEICSERLVAAQQIARGHYDAIIVDWDLEDEAILLLKGARQQKAQGLNLALVHDDAAIARAWQNGANSVIRKPIDVEQARETLATARDLILSRQTEQRDKETRLSAAQAQHESAAVAGDTSPAKSGFLSQSLTRSALEAEQNVGNQDTSGELHWQAARGPATLDEKPESPGKEVEPVSKQRWDKVKNIFRETDNSDVHTPPPPQEDKRSQDATGIFSSLPEEPATPSEPETAATPRYLVFTVAACILTAGVLYVWAPGGASLRPFTSAFGALLQRIKPKPASPETHAGVAQATVDEKPQPISTAKAEDEFLDPGPVVSTEVDPNKIQIIESKVIPKPGAQQPPTTQPPPDSDQAKELAGEKRDSEQPVVAAELPPSQEASPQQTPPPAMPVQPPVARTPENSPPASEGRVGVIIPDSLRNTPAPSPASSLEPFSVPEETALGWVIHKVDPDYPAQALQQKLDGPVVLQAWVAKDGTVRDLKLVRGYFVLGRVAIDAVRQWRFKPYTQNGKSIDFQTSITVNFRYPN
jgi:periplasmic protein TonB